MKTVEEVRRLRLDELAQEYGSLAALNEKLNLSRRDSTLSQYRNRSDSSKGDAPKVMGSAMARRLESACGKPEGWMDTDPAAWPFKMINPAALAAMPAEQLQALELAIVAAARMAGVDLSAQTFDAPGKPQRRLAA